MTETNDLEQAAVPKEEQEANVALTDPDTGLDEQQVVQALEQWGANEIPAPVTPLYMIFLRQLTGFLPLLIAVAAIVSLAVKGA